MSGKSATPLQIFIDLYVIPNGLLPSSMDGTCYMDHCSSIICTIMVSKRIYSMLNFWRICHSAVVYWDHRTTHCEWRLYLTFCLLVSKMQLFLPNKKAPPIFTEALVIRLSQSNESNFADHPAMARRPDLRDGPGRAKPHILRGMHDIAPGVV